MRAQRLQLLGLGLFVLAVLLATLTMVAMAHPFWNLD
jgi:hypothetical protein